MTSTTPQGDAYGEGVARQMGLFDASMIVAGSMIGSGIFIITGQMARDVGGAGWLLLTWVITTFVTVVAALSYGELAAMMPQAGGQYVYLREGFSPFWAFLYGWTLFFILQAGLLDAISIGFARYAGVFWPAISESRYLVSPINLGAHYAISLSTTQSLAALLIALLGWLNCKGLQYGKLVQNVFTASKIGALVLVISCGFLLGTRASVVHANFGSAWSLPLHSPVQGGSYWQIVLVGIFLAQVGSMFAADAWNNVTFIAGEIRNPERNLPRALVFGTGCVMAVYLLINLAYTLVLPMSDLQHTPYDRIGAAMLQAIFPRIGASLMSLLILVAAAGCANGLVLAGGRTFRAMALDGLFFSPAARMNRSGVPGIAITLECAWACVLLLFRTHEPATNTYGNLYSDLLDYVISSALFFYMLTVASIWRLRRKAPEAPRPYKAFGYPWLQLSYIAVATTMLAVLLRYRTKTTAPGFALMALMAPLYLLFLRLKVAPRIGSS